MIRVGVIGYGEAGSTFARAIAAHGAAVRAYDKNWDHACGTCPTGREVGDRNITFCPLPDLLDGSEIILSTVTTDRALEAARGALPYLRAGQVYCDLNSTAPSVKTAIADLIGSSPAMFVEGAVLGAIGISGARTPVLLGGKHAETLCRTLNSLGLATEFYSTDIGKASMFKMLRSVFSKGLEALVVECLMAGRKAGLEKPLWEEMTTLFAKSSFEDVARNWVLTHATAHERRYHEMKQVTEVLDELGIDSIMTTATTRFLARSTELGLADAFPVKPGDISSVIGELLRRTSAARSTPQDDPQGRP